MSYFIELHSICDIFRWDASVAFYAIFTLAMCVSVCNDRVFLFDLTLQNSCILQIIEYFFYLNTNIVCLQLGITIYKQRRTTFAYVYINIRINQTIWINPYNPPFYNNLWLCHNRIRITHKILVSPPTTIIFIFKYGDIHSIRCFLFFEQL